MRVIRGSLYASDDETFRFILKNFYHNAFNVCIFQICSMFPVYIVQNIHCNSSSFAICTVFLYKVESLDLIQAIIVICAVWFYLLWEFLRVLWLCFFVQKTKLWDLVYYWINHDSFDAKSLFPLSLITIPIESVLDSSQYLRNLAATKVSLFCLKVLHMMLNNNNDE